MRASSSLAALTAFALCSAIGCDGQSDVDQPVTETGEEGGWQTKAALAQGPRQEVAVLTLDDEIFVVGGFDETAAVVPTVEAYRPADDSWRSITDLPIALHHPNAAVHEGKLYVLGSLTGITFSADPRGWVYDPADETWTALAPLPAGTDRGGGVAVAFGEHIYVFGGVRSGAVDDVSRYHPASDSWETLGALPQPRDHLVGAAVGERIYLVGGREGGIPSHEPTVFIYNPDDDSYAEGAPMLTSRGGAAGCVLDDKIYVLGGEGYDGDDTGVFPHVEAYDPATDTWEALAPMPTPRHGMGAAALDGVIYVPGGADVWGLAAVDDHEAFVP